MNAPLQPLQPLLVADLFLPLGRELVALLRSLDGDAWRAPTVAPRWQVRDVAAHLLDGACRRLSFERDRQPPPEPAEPPADHRGLVAFLDELNATWVAAARRLSPRLTADLLELVEGWLAAHVRAVDPWGPALFPVAWAGESESDAWFDLARELTERWHHQQQIRLAVGAPPLDDPALSRPVFETFLRALPHRYRSVPAPAGTALAIEIAGRETYRWTLRHEGGGWKLLRGRPDSPAARLTLPEEPAWRLLTKGLPAAEARRRARLVGDTALAAPFFSTLAVMA